MGDRRITKRVVDGLKPQATEFAVWDSKLPGFGVRVRPSGAMSYVVVYRAGSGRGAPVRRYTTRFTKIDPFAAAAIRLLLFTGCRLREILHLKWEQVDLERGLLFLADSKTGRYWLASIGSAHTSCRATIPKSPALI